MINLSLRDLNLFLAVIEELHFGRAADRIGIAQPQLSESIRRLEDYTKVKLFSRRPKVRLTPAGEVIMEMARRLLSDIGREVDHARAIASGKMGAVKLGLSETAKFTDVPRTLMDFSELHPEVKLDLTEGNSTQLWNMLERGNLDLIVSREIRHDTEISSVPLIKSTLQLVLPEGHPLLNKEKISLKELADQPFIFFRRDTDPSYYDQIMRACYEADVKLNVVQEADSSSLMFAFVRAGFGLSFEIAEAVKFANLGVEYRPIVDSISETTMWLSYSKNHNPISSTLRGFLMQRFPCP